MRLLFVIGLAVWQLLGDPRLALLVTLLGAARSEWLARHPPGPRSYTAEELRALKRALWPEDEGGPPRPRREPPRRASYRCQTRPPLCSKRVRRRRP